eukprot:TRINITY_DN816_c0_g1_i2.p2 TRINITY_DN816_c0_g1~~TRINITY_DN816_c0_g1_i2.p2  ORF type:complete len:303 (+),score=32.46 TRINITY_DN816_c0_g1_i2:213-1121(+)
MHLGFTGSGCIFTPSFLSSKIRTCRTRSLYTSTVTMTADKMLHAVYRVGDLDASRKFLEALGMTCLRERDVPSEKYTNVFYGYGSERKGEHFSLELTYNYGVDSYDIGTGFGHFGVAVEDAARTVEKVRQAGFKVTREIEPVKGGSSVIAFVEDPTGYKFEIIQRKQRDPLCQVMLRVTDLDKTISFYEAMGMKVLRKRDNPEYKYTLVFMGFGPEEDNTVLELTFNYGENTYTPGTGYAQIAVSTPDVYEAAEQIKNNGFTLAREPGPVPGIGTKICAVRDPDGWKTVLVDAEDFEREFDE